MLFTPPAALRMRELRAYVRGHYDYAIFDMLPSAFSTLRAPPPPRCLMAL